jgi:hypothetical protein
MEETLTTRGRGLPALAVCGLVSVLSLSSCGGEDFANDPRPPEPISITGVIQEREVTISPSSFGAGPIVLTISNQTEASHTVMLVGRPEEGSRVNETAGPINPFDAATLQFDLAEGDYQVRANSDPGTLRNGIDPGPGGSQKSIQPGRIVVGPPRPSASSELQQP